MTCNTLFPAYVCKHGGTVALKYLRRAPDGVKGKRDRSKEGKRARAYRLENRELVLESERRRNLMRKYGITLEEYLRMEREQEGKCAICGKTETDSTKDGVARKLAVDHDHLSGRVRKLLCRKCNTALGSFDTILKLQRAIRYLEHHV